MLSVSFYTDITTEPKVFMTDTEQRIVKIITNNLSGGEEVIIGTDTKMEDLGINSLAFIKIIVDMENEFDIEVNDDDLNIAEFNTFGELIGTISNYLSLYD